MKNLDDRHCPDCGLSVWLSLNPNDSLEWSNPNWLRKAAQGAWLMAIVQPIALVAYLLGVGATLLEGFEDLQMAASDEFLQAAATQPAMWEQLQRPPTPSTPLATAYILIGIYFFLNAVGLLRMTSHEQRFPDRNRTIRTWSQVVSGIAVLLGIGMAGLGGFLLVRHIAMNPALSWLLVIACEVVFAVSAACAWFCLRAVARRGRRSGLARLCGYLLFLPIIPFLKAAPFFGIFFLYLLTPFVELLPLIYIPVSVFLFIRFAVMMQKAAPEAELSWASETKPVAG